MKSKKSLYFDYIDSAIKYMESNISVSLKREDIFSSVNMGETYFKKYFKEKTGRSVMQYFKEMKIHKAKKMIENSSMNFTDIASELGYESIHYFSRQFKKVSGITPTQYKQNLSNLKEVKL